ncbi:hypothetical protein KC222_10385 [Cedecea davisae]|uniref:Uncharacterized protein n=1 Tax=Cedecea davisae TaxID=158484 RepID=A0ABS6DGU1_9ENTR|nr:hypothetical protein [Cedecea davisae]MBU4682423.1 hypothetical protein [Cedecea davisae]MBU4685466.1 hypothetical protein [Cedecea davisae]
MNTTDTSTSKPMSSGIRSAALSSPQQNRKKNKLQPHVNGVCNRIEKIKIDKKTACNKNMPLYTKSLHKVRFNPDVTFNKVPPVIFTKFYDMGEF